MEFLNIQQTLDAQINFSQFNFKEMCEEEKEILVTELQGNITEKKDYFEKMISSQEELTDRYVLLHIQYVLDQGFSTNDIHIIIERVKSMYEMLQDKLIADIEEDLLYMDFDVLDASDKDEIKLENQINDFLTNMDIEGGEIIEDHFIYIRELSEYNYNMLIDLFRSSLNIKYNLNGFFKRLSVPLTEDRFVCVKDIFTLIIDNVVKDNKLSISLKTYILNEIVNFMLYTEEE